MKTRVNEKSNYRSVHLPSGKTIRFAINPELPITELEYPEFMDIKLTSKCFGFCENCYMDSKSTDSHYDDVLSKLRTLFSSIPKENQMYQAVFGGGEPTLCPEFNEVMKMTKTEFDITPTFTTNGMWALDFTADQQIQHLGIVIKYVGGVAVSTHPHLDKYWRKAVDLYTKFGIRTNLHVIISDKDSTDAFLKVFDAYKDVVEYFVLLPLTKVGRAKNFNKDLDWDYFVKNFPKTNKEKICFGANFYPYLLRNELDVKLSLYEPEILSKFVDLKDGNIYPSSFSTDKVCGNIFTDKQ